MNTENLWILLAKKLSGEASFEELVQLEELLKSGVADGYSISEIEAYWKNRQGVPSALSLKELTKRWNRFEANLDEATAREDLLPETTLIPLKAKSNKRPLYYSLAAACIVFFIAAWLYTKPVPVKVASTNEISAPERGISKVKLPDGTLVWLNSGSKLTYNNDFGKDIREVHLTGEAFFDVVKDIAHPFVVNTETMLLKVLGTAFNVRSYKDEEVTETSLVHGKIQVTLLNNSDKEITLKPLEKLVVNNKAYREKGKVKEALDDDLPLISLNYIHVAAKDTLPSEALWVENRLAFDAESFEQVAKRLERWYSVDITIKNPELKRLKFTGRFRDESLRDALKALQASSDFNFSIQQKQVTIN